MISIFFLCVKLAIFHLCVSDLGYQCQSEREVSTNKPAITLITDFRNGYFNYVLVHKFLSECLSFYNITFKNISMYSLEKTHKDENVIYFAVSHDYEEKLLENFEYGGNVSDANDAVCNKIDESKPKYDCHEIPHLVSSSVLKIYDGDLYDYVQRMKIKEYLVIHRKSCKPTIERKTSNLMIVVLCWDETVPYEYYRNVTMYPLKLIITKYYCTRELYLQNDHLLAVLAPKPFEVYSFTEYSVPTIFYDIPYMFSENKIAFQNSMNVVPWRLLKFGFLKFMQTMGWQRVLIVTDDSEYSLQFEDELIALFNKERMVYTVIRCEDANCEMIKIKQELNKVSAEIVIANVEEEHAQYLFKNAHQNITWIVRDMAKSEITSYIDVFSISLRSVNKTKGCDLDDNILAGLSSIALAYKNISNEDYEVKINEFYRRFAMKAQQIINKNEAVVVVHKLGAYYSHRKEISTMYVNESGAELLTLTDPYYGSNKTSDGTTHCFAKSYDYFKPCDDTLIIMLILIILLFIIMFLLIVCYFGKSSLVNDTRHQKFQ